MLGCFFRRYTRKGITNNVQQHLKISSLEINQKREKWEPFFQLCVVQILPMDFHLSPSDMCLTVIYRLFDGFRSENPVLAEGTKGRQLTHICTSNITKELRVA